MRREDRFVHAGDNLRLSLRRGRPYVTLRSDPLCVNRMPTYLHLLKIFDLGLSRQKRRCNLHAMTQGSELPEAHRPEFFSADVYDISLPM